MTDDCPCCGQTLPVDDTLRIDDAGFVVRRGRFAALTKQERDVFLQLVAAKGRVVSKPALLANLYIAETDEAEIKIIDVFVCKLRKKLTPLGLSIGTVWGRGYRFITEGADHE